LNVLEKKQNVILRWLFAVPAHTPIEMLLHLGRLQTMSQRKVSLACRREERYNWPKRFNKGPRLPCRAVFAALLEVCPIVHVTDGSRRLLCAYSQTLAAVRSSLSRYLPEGREVVDHGKTRLSNVSMVELLYLPHRKFVLKCRAVENTTESME
jgi:hypothetical protein